MKVTILIHFFLPNKKVNDLIELQTFLKYEIGTLKSTGSLANSLDWKVMVVHNCFMGKIIFLMVTKRLFLISTASKLNELLINYKISWSGILLP